MFVLQDAEGVPIDVQVTDNGDNTFCCSYLPTKAIKHTVIVTWGGVSAPACPFRVRRCGHRTDEENIRHQVHNVTGAEVPPRFVIYGIGIVGGVTSVSEVQVTINRKPNGSKEQ